MFLQQKPADWEFAGNIPDIILTNVTGKVSFTISTFNGGELLRESYMPDSKNVVIIKLRWFMEQIVEWPQVYLTYSEVLSYSWSAGDFSGSFRCVKGGTGVRVDAATYLSTNFLTWQPQVRFTQYSTPHYLRYVNSIDKTCECIVKAYFLDNTSDTNSIYSMSISSITTMNVGYSRIKESFRKQPTYYDIWIESEGKRISWVQRYVLVDSTSGTPDYFIFENSLGGVDTICFNGERTEIIESESKNAVFEDNTIEYDVDYRHSTKKYTGYFPDNETRIWANEFFSSSCRYHLDELGASHRIYVSKPKIENTIGEISGYEFVFARSKQSRYINMPRVELPDNLEIVDPSQELFFLAPRLNEFARADRSLGSILIPAQYAAGSKWLTIPFNTEAIGAAPSEHYHGVDAVQGLKEYVDFLFDQLSSGSGLCDFSKAFEIIYRPDGDRIISAKLPMVVSDWLTVGSASGDLGGGSGGGTTYHDQLLNRDWSDQHPMSAITGLISELASKQATIPANTYAAYRTDYVYNSDARLANARPASDVYAWAKTPEKPRYTAFEVGAFSEFAGDLYEADLAHFTNRASGGYRILYPGSSGALYVFRAGGSAYSMELKMPFYYPGSRLQLRKSIDGNRYDGPFMDIAWLSDLASKADLNGSSNEDFNTKNLTINDNCLVKGGLTVYAF